MKLHVSIFLNNNVVFLSSQDLSDIQAQMSGQVDVAVDAAPQEDLSKIMEDIRRHYETITSKNRKELEVWFQSKVKHFELLGKVIP